MESRQEIPKIVQDKQFSIRSWIIIFIICFMSTLILIFGFFALEFGLIELISNDEPLFGTQWVYEGVIATIIAPFLLLLGYPILIHLYKRALV